MTSPISAVGGAFTPLAPPTVQGTDPASGSNFATQLSSGLEKLQELHTNADDLAVKAATGELTDVHDYMIASSQASLATDLTVAVRNKALDAFNEIMRMQA